MISYAFWPRTRENIADPFKGCNKDIPTIGDKIGSLRASCWFFLWDQGCASVLGKSNLFISNRGVWNAFESPPFGSDGHFGLGAWSKLICSSAWWWTGVHTVRLQCECFHHWYSGFKRENEKLVCSRPTSKQRIIGYSTLESYRLIHKRLYWVTSSIHISSIHLTVR